MDINVNKLGNVNNLDDRYYLKWINSSKGSVQNPRIGLIRIYCLPIDVYIVYNLTLTYSNANPTFYRYMIHAIRKIERYNNLTELEREMEKKPMEASTIISHLNLVKKFYSFIEGREVDI